MYRDFCLGGWSRPVSRIISKYVIRTHRTIYVFRRVIVVYFFVSTNCGSSSEDLETSIDSVHDHSMLTHLRRQQPEERENFIRHTDRNKKHQTVQKLKKTKDGDAVDFTAVTVVASAVWTQRLIVSEIEHRPIHIYSRYRTSYSRRMKSCSH